LPGTLTYEMKNEVNQFLAHRTRRFIVDVPVYPLDVSTREVSKPTHRTFP
jgi:hypothetical protein